jgi:hypothetical protein
MHQAEFESELQQASGRRITQTARQLGSAAEENSKLIHKSSCTKGLVL